MSEGPRVASETARCVTRHPGGRFQPLPPRGITGAALDAARSAGMPALPWISLTVLGLACAAALYGLHATGRLRAPVSEPQPTMV